jgi:hypothetical protein
MDNEERNHRLHVIRTIDMTSAIESALTAPPR